MQILIPEYFIQVWWGEKWYMVNVQISTHQCTMQDVWHNMLYKTQFSRLHIPSTIWSNHVHSRHFSHYGFSIYPFPSAFHSMTVSQVASQIFISVITSCLWYMHPSYDVHTQGTWTLSKILFHGWHLATWWKIFTNF
jgi:hypothetical protein